jgi:nucleoid DNA-binding protein
MSKADIIKQIAKKMYGNVNDKNIQQVSAFCDTLEEVITDALLDEQKILWKGFISIEVNERPERKGRHPQRDEIVVFPSVKTIKCRVSKAIRDAVNGK